MDETILRELDKLLPVVERVHGGSHPELHQAAALYRALKEAPSAALFQELRQVTADYAVPEDACQAYAKTYGLLARLDEDFSR